jgi:hypothetical protein
MPFWHSVDLEQSGDEQRGSPPHVQRMGGPFNRFPGLATQARDVTDAAGSGRDCKLMIALSLASRVAQ